MKKIIPFKKHFNKKEKLDKESIKEEATEYVGEVKEQFWFPLIGILYPNIQYKFTKEQYEILKHQDRLK